MCHATQPIRGVIDFKPKCSVERFLELDDSNQKRGFSVQTLSMGPSSIFTLFYVKSKHEFQPAGPLVVK